MSVRAPARRVILGVALLLTTCALLVRFVSSGQAARPWLAPVEISAPGMLVAQSRIAVDEQGGAVAVWTRRAGDELVVQAATRPPGGDWLGPTDISATGQMLGDPQVGVAAGGDVVAVWERFARGRHFVYAAHRPAGGTWQRPTRLSDASRRSTTPQVAVDPRGNAVCVWSRYVGTVSAVQAARRPARAAWRRPVDLARGSKQGVEYTQPHVALDGRGNAVAVWTRVAGRPAAAFARESLVQAAVGPAGGRWRTATRLSATGGRASGARVAVSLRGDAVVVWSISPRTETFHGTVQSTTRRAKGRWQAPVSLSPAGEFATEPRVGVDESGDAIAIWNRSDVRGATSLRSAARVAGGRWRPAVGVSLAGERAYGGELAVGARGDAFAVWHRYLAFDERSEQTDTVVRAARLVPGGGWEAPADISGHGFQQGTAQIAADPRGGAVAVWERSVGDGLREQSATYPGD